MPRISPGPLMIQGLPSYRIKLLALTAAGAALTGIAGSLVVRRARNGEAPSVLITPTIVEVDAANVPGLYELRLAAADVAVAGHLALHVTGGTIDPTTIIATVLPRESVVTA